MSLDAAPAAQDRRYRPEVQGLRALAVVLVVVYHVWLDRVSGGVDIFLLISAFLLTGSFVRTVESGRPLELGRYWLRRFKGLLPAAAVVLAAVLAASAWLLPKSEWNAVFTQAWSSLFYVQNWTLANSSVDYYARDNSSASALQHFWSLSVQGQVFLLWPLIFAGAAVAARRLGVRYRHILTGVFGAVFACSLAFSIWQTAANQGYAYFDTRTRLWEFALGSLLALVLPYLRFGRVPRIVMGWAGVAAMLSCGLVLQVQQQFPGYMALWPTLAAALIIIAGDTGSAGGADRFLSAKPLVAMGNTSYALYLWHWPVLVFWLVTADKENAGLLDGAAVIAASCALAVLTTRLVETPLAAWARPHNRLWRTTVVVAASLALVAAPLTGWQASVRSQEQAANRQSVVDNPGALALDPGFEFAGSREAAVKPSSTGMGAEWARTDGACEETYMPADPLLDGCLRVGTAEGAARTVVVLGDSHAQQWLSALGPVAGANNWHLIALLKPGCRYGAESESRTPECNAFNAASRNYVLETAPDAAFTVASVTAPSSPDEVLADGYEAGIAGFAAAGTRVLAMRDNPRFDFDMVKCLAANDLSTQACTLPRSQLLAPVSPLTELDGLPGVHAVDMTDQLCTADECPGIIGNMFVYMDYDHLGRTYLETTAPELARRILLSLGWEGTAVTDTTRQLLE